MSEDGILHIFAFHIGCRDSHLKRSVMERRKPQMIFFDYFNTLVAEPDWCAENGNRELMRYITRNPHNCTLSDVNEQTKAVFGEVSMVRRTLGYELSGVAGNRLAFGRLGIELSLSDLEMELAFWNAASSGVVCQYAAQTLAYLKSAGIRTAVISNNAWSGAALRARLDRLLPENEFEFCISSCDYMVRKPDRRLFETALNKAGVAADSAWFCGDDFEKDVKGAHSVGMFPVLYGEKEVAADFDFLQITDWRQLEEVLASLEH